MSEFMIKGQELQKNEESMNRMAQKMSTIQGRINSVRNSLGFQVATSSSIRSRLRAVSNDVYDERRAMKNMSNGLEQSRKRYYGTENHICVKAKANWNSNKFEVFREELQKNFGLKEILSGAGYIGEIYDLINDIKDADSWDDYIKNRKDILDFIEDAADTYRKYKKIGNAVGTKKAMGWWFKKITGLKPLGRASTAKNPCTRFWNNLTNKTSPFNAQFKNIIKDFKGTNGVGKAVAAWGSVLVDGVMNWFSNKEEQANSNGTMSDGRVIAETISETAIETALTYGASIVVGAAVTTVLGTVAAPGVVVVALSGLVIAGINAGTKALTEKTTTEWLSDAILDGAEAVGKVINDGAKKVKNSIAKWFGKFSYA